MAATKPQGECASCKKLTTVICGGCSEGVDRNGVSLPSHFLCTKECLKPDRKTHKDVCDLAKHRKQLYRAGEMIQGLFYGVRELAFDREILKPKVKKSGLHVESSDRGLQELLVPFPNHLFADEDKKKVMLSWCACSENATRMYEIVEQALKGAYKEIEEVDLTVKTSKLVVYIDRVKPVYHHYVFKIDLKDSESYTLDLAGAQFGHARAVRPWAEYKADLVAKIDATHPFGWHLGMQKKQDDELRTMQVKKQSPFLPNEHLWYLAQAHITRCFKFFTKLWLAKAEINAADLVRMKRDGFVQKSGELKGCVFAELQEFVKHLKMDGKIRGEVVDIDRIVFYLCGSRFPDRDAIDAGTREGMASEMQARYDMMEAAKESITGGTGVNLNPFGEGEYEDGDEYLGDGSVDVEGILAKLRSVGMY